MSTTATLTPPRRRPPKTGRHAHPIPTHSPHHPTAQPNDRPLVTSEQFLDWLQPGIHADLINGQIFMHSPASYRHCLYTNFLDRLMGAYIEEFDLGILLREVAAVRFDPLNTFLPDLSYYTPEQAARLGGTFTDFAPALVVEVISPTSAARDRGAKFSAYETHGVQEYWLIAPDTADHHFYRRAADHFEEYAIGAPRIDSHAIPGFWLKRDWLASAERLPKVAPCLADLRATRRRAK